MGIMTWWRSFIARETENQEHSFIEIFVSTLFWQKYCFSLSCKFILSSQYWQSITITESLKLDLDQILWYSGFKYVSAISIQKGSPLHILPLICNLLFNQRTNIALDIAKTVQNIYTVTRLMQNVLYQILYHHIRSYLISLIMSVHDNV